MFVHKSAFLSESDVLQLDQKNAHTFFFKPVRSSSSLILCKKAKIIRRVDFIKRRCLNLQEREESDVFDIHTMLSFHAFTDFLKELPRFII